MRARYRWLFASVFALVMPGAWAAGGRIVFTGAVVEPTCAVDATQISTTLDDAAIPATHRACGQTITAAGTGYSSQTVTIDPAGVVNDRLLAYFARNLLVASNGRASVKLILRTYD